MKFYHKGSVSAVRSKLNTLSKSTTRLKSGENHSMTKSKVKRSQFLDKVKNCFSAVYTATKLFKVNQSMLKVIYG